MSSNPYEQAAIDRYVPHRQEKFLHPGKYYNSLVKPTVHKINKSVSVLKPMIYSKPINHEVLNALYLQPKVIDLPVTDELASSRAAFRLENMNQSKVMSATKSKEVKF